ncbi:MAG TPA: FG-GAP-like repeat-containing protein [Phycisphaerae bacterium]|nr:FG-GAP-like repeat-containing protein [Phycisphaerae bacterium]
MRFNLTSCVVVLVVSGVLVLPVRAQKPRVEVSDDGHQVVVLGQSETDGTVTVRGSGVPYGTSPDWQNDLRRQVGGLQAEDMNGDGLIDVVVGCYHSDSYPPYTDWENYIYYNIGGELEASPSWVSTDEVSTGNVQVADINGDTYPDIFAATGYYTMDASVIYWGSSSGPAPTPGWYSAEPGRAWNNYAVLFDFDHDNDIDVITANQGVYPDSYRPIYIFRNHDGTLETVPSWQSAEWSIQGFLAMADYDGDGWEDLAVSKWVNFESGIYKNAGGTLQTSPVWTTGDDDSDKGVAWADVDDDDWPDLVLGHDPTLLYGNEGGTLSVTWSSGAGYFGHSDIRFCDVDRDGDPDLAETHFSDGKVHIYLNQDGTLETMPSWTYDSPTVGTAIAFGDITGNGWPDLIVGNSGEPSVKVFYAQIPGDLNGDGCVDQSDLGILLADWGCTGGDCPGDCDNDGDTDQSDLGILLAHWGEGCP